MVEMSMQLLIVLKRPPGKITVGRPESGTVPYCKVLVWSLSAIRSKILILILLFQQEFKVIGRLIPKSLASLILRRRRRTACVENFIPFTEASTLLYDKKSFFQSARSIHCYHSRADLICPERSLKPTVET
jgi:hypothetical protein